MNLKWLLAVSAISMSVLFPPEVLSVDDGQLGVEAYKKKNYPLAVRHFEAAMKGKNPNARIVYYLADSNLNCGKNGRAKQLFGYIVLCFPDSPEAGLAKTALAKLNPAKPAAAITIGPDGIPKVTGGYKDKRIVHTDEEYKREYGAIPPEVSIPFATGGAGGASVLAGSINGQHFYLRNSKDWESRMSPEDLARARVPAPKGPPDDKEDGKGVWKSAIDVTVGRIKRKVPVLVIEGHKGYPELGSAFFEDLRISYAPSHMVLRKSSPGALRSPQLAVDDYNKEYAGLPDVAEVRFTNGAQGHMMVNAEVNGRKIDCMFDTGANAFFGFEHCHQVGIPIPTGPADSYARGWAGRPVEIWKTSAKVKLGNMTRVVPIAVSREWDKPPLLGQEFVRDFQYNIDGAGGRMVLTKKTANTASTSRPRHALYDVPCEVENEREYVNLKVNGRTASRVLIDTGASFTILSGPTAAALGIEIPAGAPTLTAGGVGGNVMLREVYCDLTLGPIHKTGFPVKVGGAAGSAIGQDFMSGWRFTVDRDERLLRFFH